MSQTYISSAYILSIISGQLTTESYAAILWANKLRVRQSLPHVHNHFRRYAFNIQQCDVTQRTSHMTSHVLLWQQYPTKHCKLPAVPCLEGTVTVADIPLTLG